MFGFKIKYRKVEIPEIYSYLGEKYPENKNFSAHILCRFERTYLCLQLFLP